MKVKKFIATKNYLSAVIKQDLILLSTTTRNFCSLNQSSEKIWQLLQSPLSLVEIAKSLNINQHEVEQVIQELYKQDLVKEIDE